MCCFSYLYRELRIFWRYRNNNNNYEKYKYYLVILLVNIVMTIFYWCYSRWTIVDPSSIFMTITVVQHILTVLSIIITHSTNPGKIRQILREKSIIKQKQQSSEIIPSNGKIYIQQAEPHSYRMICRGRFRQIKFCTTCNVYRPHLTSHCAKCKGCVLERDHHCTWLANCIGKSNYKKFYFHLTVSVCLGITVTGMCIWGWIKIENKYSIPSLSTIGVFLVSLSVSISLLILWFAHTYFGLVGVSTRIFLKKYKKSHKISPSSQAIPNENYESKDNFIEISPKSPSKKMSNINPPLKSISQVEILHESTFTTSQQFNFNPKQQRYEDQIQPIPTEMIESKIPFIKQQSNLKSNAIIE